MSICQPFDPNGHKWELASVDVDYQDNGESGFFNKTFNWRCSLCLMPMEMSRR